ncbi:MAG: hypothetical protein A2X83_05610 [Desulfuromonadales bacterium GWD2_54_10]|nr:MAG: hypothetical protein A2X83_05610 [Desulfuromonadales bacterium GWD2_54_10]
MKIRILLAVVAMMGISSMAFGDEIDNRFQKARKYLNDNKMTITATVDQAFSQDAILVVGEGVPKKGTTGGQRRLTAKTAAKVVAQRRLAEMLEGVAIVSETTVKDSELVSDAIKTAVTGFIKGTQVVMEDWSSQEETALVIIKVGMSGPKSFAALMYEKILTEPKVKQELDKPAYTPPADVPPPVAAVQAYDGLIIDATDYSFRPALINRIFNPKGDVLYDPAKISQKVLVEQGCGEYTNSVDKAKAALGKRGVKNPLVVKASGTVSPSDLQVSDDTAVKVFTANQASGFMADARVAFVLK